MQEGKLRKTLETCEGESVTVTLTKDDWKRLDAIDYIMGNDVWVYRIDVILDDALRLSRSKYCEGKSFNEVLSGYVNELYDFFCKYAKKEMFENEDYRDKCLREAELIDQQIKIRLAKRKALSRMIKSDFKKAALAY